MIWFPLSSPCVYLSDLDRQNISIRIYINQKLFWLSISDGTRFLLCCASRPYGYYIRWWYFDISRVSKVEFSMLTTLSEYPVDTLARISRHTRSVCSLVLRHKLVLPPKIFVILWCRTGCIVYDILLLGNNMGCVMTRMHGVSPFGDACVLFIGPSVHYVC